MPKKKLVKIAEEQEVDFDEAMRIAVEKLPEGGLPGRGGLASGLDQRRAT